MAFSVITWFTSVLLADCYRSPDIITGRRNYTYMDAVRANLGGMYVPLCGVAQYATLVGATIGYTITGSISMVAVKRSNCFHKHHTREGCHISYNGFIILFGLIEVVLSQIPNFHKLSVLSIIAAAMSFAYSSIGLGLSIAHVAGGARPTTSITGIPVGNGVTGTDKMFNTFSALGNAAFAYAFSLVLVEIQDTLKSSPPENKVMKKAAFIGISISTMFYMLCGIMGYAAFGNDAPGNILTGFGFFEPFWLIDVANICIMIHLVGAFQVLCQPVYAFVEEWSKKKWPESEFVTKEYLFDLPWAGISSFSIFRLVWRTAYVVFTVIVAMIFPNFNDVVGLVGAISFWPLTIFFPIEMYIAQAKLRRFSFTWIWMQILSFACLIISLLAAAGSINGLIKDLPTLKPFKSMS
ncbi:OLC1v1002858C2 [Oldenlandia corymbosa var. corymbosa]|nr:OLC1v1002858C2 [Oldenlandia corymbosa var. corymbosa]